MTEPILVSIAAALAGKTVTSLYDLVKKRFAGNAEATRRLDEASASPGDDTKRVALAEVLATEESEDAEFATALRAEWTQVNSPATGAVVNQIHGTVSGGAVQAGNVQGGISFGR